MPSLSRGRGLVPRSPAMSRTLLAAALQLSWHVAAAGLHDPSSADALLSDFCSCGEAPPSHPKLRAQYSPPDGVLGEEGRELSAAMSDHLEALDATKVVVWGLLLEHETHTHHFIHQALFRAALASVAGMPPAADSGRRRCACWLDRPLLEGEGGVAAVEALLDGAVVFASPLHDDSGVRDALPEVATAYYVFHETAPERFEALRRRGRAVSMKVWRRPVRGLAPIPSSVLYPNRRDQDGDLPSVYAEYSTELGLVNMLWASDALPGEIEAVRAQLPELLPRDGGPAVFVGTLWDRNAAALADFVRGCAGAGVDVHHWGGVMSVRAEVAAKGAAASGLHVATNGSSEANTAGGEVYEVQTLPNFVHKRYRPSAAEAATLMRLAFLAPAVQGYGHFKDDTETYIADRVFQAAAAGQVIVTNNPGVARLFAGVPSAPVVHGQDTERLCADAAGFVRGYTSGTEATAAAVAGHAALMDHVARFHTYLSRWNTLLALLRKARFDSSGEGGEDPWGTYDSPAT